MGELAKRLRSLVIIDEVGSDNPLGRDAADRIEALEAALVWYSDQMCEGLCEGKDPKICAAIGYENCAGCPAVVALHKSP